MTNVGKVAEGDVLKVSLLYTTFLGSKYAIVIVHKNGKVISNQNLKTNDVLWPVIQIGGTTAKIEVKMNPGENAFGEYMTGITFFYFLSYRNVSKITICFWN